MAYYCNICGRKLKNADAKCKYCGDAAHAVDPAAEQPVSATAVATAEPPKNKATAPSEADKLLEQLLAGSKTAANSKSAPAVASVEQPAAFAPTAVAPAPKTQPAAKAIDGFDVPTTQLSSQESPSPEQQQLEYADAIADTKNGLFGDLDEPDEPARRKKRRWPLIAGIAVAVIAAVVLGIFTPMFGIGQDPAAKEYLTYLTGTWISQDFMYSAEGSPRLVEVLSVESDGSFTMRYLVPDDTKPNGWSDGSWKVEYEVSGTVELTITEDQKLLRLLHEDEGGFYYYERFFIARSDEEMTLREFYDETNSYDMVFTRAKSSAANNTQNNTQGEE